MPFTSGIPTGDPHRLQKDFPGEHAALFGPDQTIPDSARLARRRRHAPWDAELACDQQLDRVPVQRSRLNAHVARSSKIIALDREMTTELQAAAFAGLPRSPEWLVWCVRHHTE